MRCLDCPQGTTISLDTGKCVKCPSGTYKSEIMQECLPCAPFAYPINNQTSCSLYAGYNFGNRYFLNTFLWENSTSLSENDVEEVQRIGKFIGPLRSNDKTEIFFLSLIKPVKYDLDKYDYHVDAGNVQLGHIFGLVASEFEFTSKPTGKKRAFKQTQHRDLVNFGSKIKSVDFITNGTTNKTVILYSGGDYCRGSWRYRTKVTIECSKKASKLSYIEYTGDGIFLAEK